MSKEAIFKTTFSDEFDNLNVDDVFLLSKEESASVWSKYIDKKASSYFKLEDNNWLITSKRLVIGNWLEDFNRNRTENVRDILSNNLSWNKEDIVWFCISRALIIEAPWEKFRNHWICFLQCEDDCPILINRNSVGSALIFRPIGDILKIMIPPDERRL